jgi:hypothetical protein
MEQIKQNTGMRLHKYTLFFIAIGLFFAFSDLCAQNQEPYSNYLTQRLQKVPKFKGFEGQDSIPHYFFQFYGGYTFSLIPGAKKGIKNPGLEIGVAVGRWFTPIHGARIGLFGKYYNSYPLGKDVISNDLGISLDYLMNFSALAKDFNAIRRFELVGIAGGEYLLPQFVGSSSGTFGIRTGLQARYALGYGSVFYIEPLIGIYSDNLDRTDNWHGYNVAGSIVGGMELRSTSGNKHSEAKFTSSAFKDHSFLFSGIGVGRMIARGANPSEYMGGSFFAGIGRWVSPFSGVRLTGKASIFKYPDASKISSLGLQTDYLLNLSNMFYGYDPQRRFELIGVGGVDYDYLKNGGDTNLFGLGTGLQASVRLSRDVKFFVEPRLNYYPDQNYAVRTNGQGKSSANFLINAGFEFISNPLRANSSQAKISANSFLDNMFFGTSFGLNAPINKASFYKHNVDPRVTGYLGKWFTSTSGVRISADIGKLWKSSQKPSAPIATIGADYLWNITSFMDGYDPKRVFELIGAAGANIAFRSSTFSHSSYLGGELSLQGLWNVTPSFGLFVEPQLRLYPDKFSTGNIRFAKWDGVAAVMAGINIRLKDCNNEQRRIFRKKDLKNAFFSFSAGTAFLANHINRSNAFGESGQFAFGKWYTPVSAWRIGMNGEYLREKHIRYLYGGAEADYMVSISNGVFGFDPDRRLDLNAFVGVNVGMDYERGKIGFAPGLSAGGQVVFKATPTIDLFIEPKATLRTTFKEKSSNQERGMMTVQLGLNYKFSPSKISHSKDFATDDHPGYFISANFSEGFYSGSLVSGSKSKNPYESYGIAFGKRMSPVSYLRLGLNRKGFDNANKVGIDVTAINADYLANLSTLIGGYDKDRNFEILGVVGGSINFASKSGHKSTLPLGFKLGMQSKINLSKTLDLTVEPALNFYNKSIDKSDSRQCKANGELTVGISYKL